MAEQCLKELIAMLESGNNASKRVALKYKIRMGWASANEVQAMINQGAPDGSEK